jgi:hypothetical protein
VEGLLENVRHPAMLSTEAACECGVPRRGCGGVVASLRAAAMLPHCQFARRRDESQRY